VRHRIVDPPIRLPSPEKPLSPPIIRLDRAAVGYGDHPVLKGLTLSISNDDRIGLLGANGNGKSTFVKLIADRLKPMGGEIVRAPKIDIAFFAQHQLDELDADATPALLVRRKMPQAGEAQVRSRAAQIGFGEAKADTPVTRLSGGEKARLLLGLAAFEGPHLLILDEPTNHLDIPARDALVEAIAAYKGAVIIVSHDRFLLDATCDRLWLVKDGRVQPFEGDIDDYAKLVLAGDAAPTSGKTDVSTTLTETSAPPVKRREAGHLKREIGKAEAEMARLSELIRRVDAALAAPDAFQRDPVKAGKLAADRGALADKLARIEEQWLTLSGELEGAG
jgi:ATP-binding cassette subfamily F protein 3